MNSIHFKFAKNILIFDEYNFSEFRNEIVQNTPDSIPGVRKSMLTIRSDDDSINVTFLPDNFTLKRQKDEPGFVLKQYDIQIIKLPFNDMSRPYELHFSQFGKKTIAFFNFSYVNTIVFFVDHSSMQLPLLCVKWGPISKSYETFFKVFSCTGDNYEDKRFVKIKSYNLDAIEDVFPIDAHIQHLCSDGTWKRIKLPIGKDCLFHYINEDENETETAPILTFNQLLQVYPIPIKEADDDPGVSITLESSFNKQILSHNDKQKEIILKYLVDSLGLYQKNGCFYAQFVTICQSSGVGKSKFILECGETIPLIYGVFRSISDKGYPPMSAWIDNFVKFVLEAKIDSIPKSDFLGLVAINYSMGRVLLFIDALLKAFKDLFVRLQTDGKSDAQVIKEINAKFYTVSGQAEFNSLIEDRRSSKVNFNELFESIRSYCNYFSSKMPADYKKAPFVIVFDELSLLLDIKFPNHLNLFHIIRRALHLLPATNRYNLLIVGIGTNGDVSVFHKELNDDSLRYLDGKMFLPPLIMGSNWDIFKSFIKLKDFKLSFDNALNPKMIKLLCTFGRAMWSSLPFTSMIPVAKKKLRNGSDTKFYTALAIWSIRTGLALNSDLVVSRTLLRSYMAILYSINFKSESMSIGYPSEPMLAITAREYIKEGKFSFHCLLRELHEFVQTRPIDKGELTEHILSLVVLLAIDNAENVTSESNIEMNVDNDPYLRDIFSSSKFLLETVPSKINVDGNEDDNNNNMDMEIENDAVQDALNVESDEKHYDDDIDDGDDGDDVGDVESDNLDPNQDNYDMNVEQDESELLERFYHITTVEKFLKSLLGDANGARLSSLLKPNLRQGLVNATHVISALRNFPYEGVYGNTEAGNIKFRKSGRKMNNIIDQALLRSLFIRQAMLIMPPRYPGLDMCIPVLMKRNLTEAGSRAGLFGYIGLQFKATYEPAAAVIAKMRPRRHYVPCGKHSNCNNNTCKIRTKRRDMEFIYKNHLMIYLTTSFVEDNSETNSEAEAAAEPETEPEQADNSPSADIIIGNDQDSGVPYLVARSIQKLAVIDDTSAAWIQNIIHAQNDPFKHVNATQYRMVADNVLTMSAFRYPEADSELRTARDFEPIPDPFDNKAEWWDQDKIMAVFDNAAKQASYKILSSAPQI